MSLKKRQFTDLDEINQFEVDILDYVAKICDNNNLKYLKD